MNSLALLLLILLLPATPLLRAQFLDKLDHKLNNDSHSARIFSSRDHGRTWHPSDQGFPATATVNDLAVHNGTVLAGTDKHGAFISTNLGQQWLPLANSLPPNLKIDATAFHHGAWFLGTHQHGIYKSTTNNTTTSSITNWTLANDGLTNLKIRRLAVSSEHLYAATDAGLFRFTSSTNSTNSTITWQHLHGSSQVTGITLYQTNIYYSDIHGILRSSDNGKTFQRVNHEGTPHNLASTANAVFATFYGGLRVKKSEDNGRTWLPSGQGLPIENYTFQIRPVRNLLFASQWDGIYLSRDQGTTWSTTSTGLPNSAITDVIHVADQTLLAAAGLLKE